MLKYYRVTRSIRSIPCQLPNLEIRLEFDQHGNLSPAQALVANLENIEAVLVNPFSTSSTRHRLWKNYLIYLSEVRDTIGTGFYQWIDGSFATLKPDPGDIDLMTFLDWQTYELHERELRDQRRAWGKRGLDCYYMKVYPEDHKMFYLYEMDLALWKFQFGYSTRTNRNKGYLQINF